MKVTLNKQNHKSFPVHFTVLCSKNAATCLFCCVKMQKTVILSRSFLALLLLFLQPHSSACATMLFIVVAFVVVIASCYFHAVAKAFAMFH